MPDPFKLPLRCDWERYVRSLQSQPPIADTPPSPTDPARHFSADERAIIRAAVKRNFDKHHLGKTWRPVAPDRVALKKVPFLPVFGTAFRAALTRNPLVPVVMDSSISSARPGLSTKSLARAIDRKPGSIRVRLCQTGSYYGIRPWKLPDGRLIWPSDSIERLLSGNSEAKV